MYFFIFSLQITKFPCKELPVLPVFSRPGAACFGDSFRKIL